MMFTLDGKISDVKLNPDIKVIKFGGCDYKEGLMLSITENNGKYAYFSIPIDNIPNNPIEERRLYSELVGSKAVYKKEVFLDVNSNKEKSTLVIKSGKLKGLTLNYEGNYIDNN